MISPIIYIYVYVKWGYARGYVVFAGANYTDFSVGTNRSSYSATISLSGLAPGTYTVGFCIWNHTTTVINNNDRVNGWFMVHN